VDRREFTIRVVSPAAFTVLLFVVWEIVCRVLNVPLTILPAPSDVFGALWQYRKPIIDNSWVTLWTTLAGFLIATVFGLALGIAVGWHRALYAGIYPVLIGFNSIPKVAVVPVLILWFGIGELPAVLTAFLISFFPIVVNVATGLATTEPELEDVLRDVQAARKVTVMLVTHDLREAVFLADTVYVMSSRPGRIVRRRTVDLPRPRDLEVTYTQAFQDIVHELRGLIGKH